MQDIFFFFFFNSIGQLLQRMERVASLSSSLSYQISQIDRFLGVRHFADGGAEDRGRKCPARSRTGAGPTVPFRSGAALQPLSPRGRQLASPFPESGAENKASRMLPTQSPGSSRVRQLPSFKAWLLQLSITPLSGPLNSRG